MDYKYEIIGTYHGVEEVIDYANSEKSAEYLKNEYQIAYGPEWVVSILPKGKSNEKR